MVKKILVLNKNDCSVIGGFIKSLRLISFLIALCIFMTALTSCREKTRLHEFGYTKIDTDLAEKFTHTKFNHSDVFILNSYGGYPSIALTISEFIVDNDLSLLVNKECLSACSEVILPASRSIVLQNSPIIGFHWSPQMNKYLLEKYAERETTGCNWSDIPRINEIYSLRELNEGFWLTTLKKLHLKEYKILYKNEECPWHKKTFENHMWLPNSQQLKTLWGLEFKGQVCSDTPLQCMKRIDRRWKKGTRLVIGDDIYVSKGNK